MDYIKTSGPSEGAHKCRCCLQKGDHPQNLHEELYTKLLRETLNLVLTSDSRLPQSICSTCARFLQQAKKFRNMVIASERQLLQEFILNNWQTEPQDENDLIADNFQKEISLAGSAEISKQKDPLSDCTSVKIEKNDENIRISEAKSLRSQERDDQTSDSLCKVESSVADKTGSYDDDDDMSRCSDGQRSGDDSDYEEVPEIKKRRGEAKNWVLVNKFTDVDAAEEAIKQENTWSTYTTHKTQDGTKRLYRMRRKAPPGGRKIGNISEETMKKALEEIRDGKSVRGVSKERGIPFATLYRYNVKMKARGSTEIRLQPNYAVNKIFDAVQEQALKEYFEKCALMFYGLSTKDCRKVAYEMAVLNNLKMPPSWTKNQLAGIEWLKAFRKRHSELSLRRPEACSSAGATSFNKPAVNTFFDNLQNVYHRHPCFADGTRVFNLDETAITTVQKSQTVIGLKGKNNKVTSEERRILVTTCLIICAAGYALPPVLIFPRENFEDHMLKGAPPGTLGLATPTGWMNTETFVQTMAHFIKRTSSSVDNPSLLVMDNHESHLSIEALDLAKANGVTILILHPHTTSKMQPLDVEINSTFKVFYDAELDSLVMRNPENPVSIYVLSELIGNAFNKAMTPTNIINAFKKTGIFPLDRNVFSEDNSLPSSVIDHSDPGY